MNHYFTKFASRVVLGALLLCGLDGCSKLTYTPSTSAEIDLPKFDGVFRALAASDTKIVLHWKKSKNATKYKIYYADSVVNLGRKDALPQPLASTDANQFIVTGLTGGNPYTFVVHAENAAGEERNKHTDTATTFVFPHVPDFEGVGEGVQLTGTPGLTSVELSWRSAVGTVAGYQVFAGKDYLQEDFTSPVLTVPAVAGVSNYKRVVTGLEANTLYYFVVRAYLTDPDVDLDRNTMETTVTTLNYNPPTFAGVKATTPFGGPQGFTMANVTWDSPAKDGVWNRYFVDYELGTCAEGFSSSPTRVTVSDLDGTVQTAQLASLTGNQRYRVRVNANFTDANHVFSDTNSKCVDVLMQPSPANFTGISTLTLYGPGVNVATLTQSQLNKAFNSIVATWNPLDIGTAQSFSAYQIDVATDAAFVNMVTASMQTITDMSANKAVITSLEANKTYYVRVYVTFSFNAFSIDPVGKSVVMSATTTPIAPNNEGINSMTATPKGVIVAGGDSLKVSWSPPTNPGAVFNGFRLYGICADNSGTVVPQTEIPKLLTDPTGYMTSQFNALHSRVFIADPFYTGPAANGGTIQAFPGASTVATGLPANGGSTYSQQVSGLTPNQTCCFQSRAFYLDGAGNRLQSLSAAPAQCLAPSLVAPAFAGVTGVTVPEDPSGFYSAKVTFPAIDAGQTDLFSYYEIGAFPTVTGNTATDWSTVQDAVVIRDTTPYDIANPTLPRTVTIGLSGTLLTTNRQYWFAVRVVNDVNGSKAYNGGNVNIGLPGDGKLHPNSPRADAWTSANAMSTPNSITGTYVGPPTPVNGNPSTTGGVYNGALFYIAIGTSAAASLHNSATQKYTGAVYTSTPAAPSAGSCSGSGIITCALPVGGTDVTYALPASATTAIVFVPFTTAGQNVKLKLANLTPNVTWAVSAYGSYWDGSSNATSKFLESSTGPSTITGLPSYSTINFLGLKPAAELKSAYSDGTAKVFLPFAVNPATGSVANYYVYYSAECPGGTPTTPTCTTPISLNPSTVWQTVAAPPASDTNYSATGLTLSNLGNTLSGDAYYFVVAVNESGATDYTYSSQTWSYVSIPSSQANYVKVPKATSGLAYDYWLGAYEASLPSGASFPGSPNISTRPPTSSGATLATCTSNFRAAWSSGFDASKTYHTSCFSGAFSSSGFPAARSIANASPAVATFGQAYASCRMASSQRLAVRMPSGEEWRRAARWSGNNYSNLWKNCVTNTTSASNTGSVGNCLNPYGAYDLAGNMREWVDNRLAASAATTRFGYSPSFGSLIGNGLDNLSYVYHDIAPYSSVLGLLMGSDFRQQTTSNFKFPSTIGSKSSVIDSLTESWEDVTTSDTSTGFRCVAFPPSKLPTEAQLALPAESTYQSTDLALGTAVPTNRVIPDNLFIGDRKPEALTIATTYTPSPMSFGATVTLTWVPWSKTVCGVSGCNAPDSSGFTYYIYRMPEPTLVDNRTAFPWAINDGPYNANWTGGGVPLDPFAVTSSGNKIWPVPTAAGMIIASSSCGTTCTFTDSSSNTYNYPGSNISDKSFSPQQAYYYLVVAKDPEGNYMPAMVQRYRPPYFVGDTSRGFATATFRTEPRFRRAAAFLVDDGFQSEPTNDRQSMVHVPLDRSGLDHDYYIYRHYAFATSGSFLDASNEAVPSARNGTEYSTSACVDNFQRTGQWSNDLCGSNGTTASGTAAVRSLAGDAPATTVWGSAFKACRLTAASDSNGFRYAFYLPSNAEWTKAADWGDLDRDGTISDPLVTNSALLTKNAGDVEFGLNICNQSGPTQNNNGSPNCQSRYGMVGMVHNLNQIVSDRYNTKGLDNGTDGLMLNLTIDPSSGTLWTKIDLLRSIQLASGIGSAITFNLDAYNGPASGSTTTMHRGGDYAAGTYAGRYAHAWFSLGSADGFRCAF